jgi:hypothetical protein
MDAMSDTRDGGRKYLFNKHVAKISLASTGYAK